MQVYGQDELRFIDWNRIHYSLEWIYEGSPPKVGTTGNHHFAGLSAWLILNGSVTIAANDHELVASRGDWVFPPFESDRRHFSEDAEILSIRFRATWGGDNEFFQEAVPRSCSASVFPKLERTARRLLKVVGPDLTSHKNKITSQHISVEHHIQIYACFIQWLAEYIRTLLKIGARAHKVVVLDDRVQAAKTYLDTVSLRSTFRESTVAEHVGISLAHLNRLFLKEIGMSPSAYHRSRRLDTAKRMLIDSAAPIKLIGYELGFNDPSNFTNWFRMRTRQSPKEFRAEAMSPKANS